MVSRSTVDLVVAATLLADQVEAAPLVAGLAAYFLGIASVDPGSRLSQMLRQAREPWMVCNA